MAKDPNFYTSLLGAWSTPMMQAFQQIKYEFDDGQLQKDTFLSDLINLKIGTPYPAMGSHFGK